MTDDVAELLPLVAVGRPVAAAVALLVTIAGLFGFAAGLVVAYLLGPGAALIAALLLLGTALVLSSFGIAYATFHREKALP